MPEVAIKFESDKRVIITYSPNENDYF